MGDKFYNYNSDRESYGGGGGGAGDVSSRFSVPPPNFQVQNNDMRAPQPASAQNYFQNQGNPKRGGGFGQSSGGSFGGGKGDSYGGGYGGGSRDEAPMRNGGGNRGGFNKGYGGSDMITQEDTIFVSGMDPSITELEINSHFGAIGVIKKDKKTMKPKIWLYKHKDTGLSKGEATVTYDDVNAAKSAISWFDGRDFNGSTVRVSLAQRQNNWNKGGGGGGGGGGKGGSMGGDRGGGDRGSGRSFDRDFGGSRDEGRGGGRQGGGGGGGGPSGGSQRGGASGLPQREGDWRCSECSNTNFAWRNECNRCKAPKGDQPMGGGGGGDMSSRGGKPDGRKPFRSNPQSGFQGGNFGNKDGNGSMNPRFGSGPARGGGSMGGGGMSNRRDAGPMRSNNERGGRPKPY